MPRDEVEKLKDRVDELESENDALQDQIDSIPVRFRSRALFAGV